MSEYTSIYLRDKEKPLLNYKEYPNYEEIKELSNEERMARIKEIKEYNKNVSLSYGCELFYLTTTPSRQLEVLPWSDEPTVLTEDLLDEVISFYDEEIQTCQKSIAEKKENIIRLEDRIRKANVELYDRINEEINDCRSSISFWDEEYQNWLYWRNKFAFLKGIMDNESNSEHYELIYTKC